MTLKKKITKLLKLAFCIAAMLPALTACVADDFDLGEGSPEDVICFQAAVVPITTTRANHYIAEGEVSEGTYGVLYKAPTQKSSSWPSLQITCEPATVDFGYEEGPTTGFAYYESDGKRKDLKWSKVYGKGSSSVPFFIHNVQDPSRYTWDTYGNTMTFKKDSEGHYPYYFSPLDKEFGTNDLLCGSVEATNKTGKIVVPLNHILSLLKVQIEVYAASDEFFVDLSRAEVTFGTILSEISMFAPYRATEFFYGSSSPPQGQQSVPKVVTMVDPADKTNLCWDGDPVEGSLTTEDGVYSKMTYTTKEFVVPPQSVPYNSSTKRPMLIVKVPKEDATGSHASDGYVTYSGYIPDIMFETDADGNITGWTPLTLAFNSGYEVTITATINSPETELNFAPVKVETWVDKGVYNLSPKQAGIYKPEQFYAMAEYYRQGRFEELGRFGYWDSEGNFVPQFWANVTLDKEKVLDSMRPESGELPAPFYFVFNNYTVSLTDGNGNISDALKDSPGELELYSMVTGRQADKFIGIKNLNDLLTVVNLFESGTNPSLQDLKKYGTVTNGDNTITFRIENTLSANLHDVFRKLPRTYQGKTIILNVNEGAQADLYIEGASQTYHITTRGGSETNYMQKLVVAGTPNVASDWEYYLMYDAYNTYCQDFPEMMDAFGTRTSSTSKYTISFTGDMTLDGSKVFLAMVPDGTDARPDFTASIQSGYTVTVQDQYVPSVFTHTSLSSTTFDYIEKALQGTGAPGVTSSADIGNIASHYGTCATNRNYANLWRLGKFENGKWTFPLKFNSTSYSYVSYSNFFGKMMPDESAGRYDYEFIISTNVEVRSVPTDLSGLSSTTMTFNQNGYTVNYPSDADALHKMADGSYWTYYEQWKASRQSKKHSKRR